MSLCVHFWDAVDFLVVLFVDTIFFFAVFLVGGVAAICALALAVEFFVEFGGVQ